MNQIQHELERQQLAESHGLIALHSQLKLFLRLS